MAFTREQVIASWKKTGGSSMVTGFTLHQFADIITGDLRKAYAELHDITKQLAELDVNAAHRGVLVAEALYLRNRAKELVNKMPQPDSFS